MCTLEGWGSLPECYVNVGSLAEHPVMLITFHCHIGTLSYWFMKAVTALLDNMKK